MSWSDDGTNTSPFYKIYQEIWSLQLLHLLGSKFRNEDMMDMSFSCKSSMICTVTMQYMRLYCTPSALHAITYPPAPPANTFVHTWS